jgi:hypothetical protein
MHTPTRSSTAADRVITNVIFVAASLLAFGTAFAQQASLPAEHKYLVEQCTARAAAAPASQLDGSSAQKMEVPPESYRAQCEVLQREIDRAWGTFQLGEAPSISRSSTCSTGNSSAKTDGASSCQPGGRSLDGTRVGAGATDTSRVSSGFAEAFARSRIASIETGCVGVSCMADMKPGYLYPYDPLELERRFRMQTTQGSDFLEDLVYPGFGRWEKKRDDDLSIRVDFLNPRRCSRLQRLGVCLSMTMH